MRRLGLDDSSAALWVDYREIPQEINPIMSRKATPLIPIKLFILFIYE
jgi:hypothetical protein